MRVVLDTNVFVSGVFFAGPPHQILDAWRRGVLNLVISTDILEEYRRVGEELARRFPGVDLAPVLELLAVKARLVRVPPLPVQVCADPDDDKFLACALASRATAVCSGDAALRRASGYGGIQVLSPRQFVDKYLKPRSH